MASQARWTWVWVNSRRWWWIGRPGMLQFIGSQRVRHDWVAELNWNLISLCWHNICLWEFCRKTIIYKRPITWPGKELMSVYFFASFKYLLLFLYALKLVLLQVLFRALFSFQLLILSDVILLLSFKIQLEFYLLHSSSANLT